LVVTGGGKSVTSSAVRLLREQWLLIAGLLLATSIRIFLIPVAANRDIDGYLLPWYREIVDHGRLESLGKEIGNYTPPYMYLLALASLLPGKPIVAVKAIPFVFDLLAAFAAFRIVRIFHASGAVPLLAAGCFLLCPTVIVNGSMWGQCDVVYAAFLLLSLMFVLKDRAVVSAVCFSVALSIKLQAILFLPALGLAFISRGLSPLYFLLTPAAYVAFSVPPLLLGRSAESLFTVYTRQFDTFSELTLNAASIYQWLPLSATPRAQVKAGIAFAAAACALSGYALSRLPSRPLRTRDLLTSAWFLTALLPFLLPKMHERYAFTSDALCCIVPFVAPSLSLPALLLLGGSFASYGPYMNVPWLPLPYASLLNLAGLVLIARHLARDLGISARLQEWSPPDEGEQRTRSGDCEPSSEQQKNLGGAS
jgi:Gpi18-like mannosyltransferase